MRDYEDWHHAYDDPASGLSWRLGVVRGYLRDEFAAAKPLRVVSICAGDGRDVLGVLAERPRPVSVTLLEINPTLADAARASAAGLDEADVEVRTLDAGTTDAYAGLVPADVVLLVGVLGNIADDDIFRTLDAMPAFCASGALLVWSRRHEPGGLNDRIQDRLQRNGFAYLDYRIGEDDDPSALGAVRYTGPPVLLEPGHRLFTFIN